MLEIKLWIYICEVARERQRKMSLSSASIKNTEIIHCSKNTEELTFESKGKVSLIHYMILVNI